MRPDRVEVHQAISDLIEANDPGKIEELARLIVLYGHDLPVGKMVHLGGDHAHMEPERIGFYRVCRWEDGLLAFGSSSVSDLAENGPSFYDTYRILYDPATLEPRSFGFSVTSTDFSASLYGWRLTCRVRTFSCRWTCSGESFGNKWEISLTHD